MKDAREFAEQIGKHVTIMVGVIADHDSAMAQELLDELTAVVMSLPDAPLLPHALTDDCLVAPPERGNAHLEIRWISL